MSGSNLALDQNSIFATASTLQDVAHKRGETNVKSLLIAAAASFGVVATAYGAPPLDTPATLAHVQAASALAKDDLRQPLFLCRADSGIVVRQNLAEGSDQWIAPTQLFDNLFYIGNRFVGVYVLKTSGGLILFDSTTSADEAQRHLVPGLRRLGLSPQDIKYVVVTHGHWDHFGGAAYLQQTYGARIGLSAADWAMIEAEPAGGPERMGHPIPKRDLVIGDGDSLTLGDTAITLYLTPGHTPGTVSAIVQARDGSRRYALSLLGSVAFPTSLEPTDRVGGLRQYDQSVLRFAEISRKAGAVGLLNTHVFADGGLERLAAVAKSRRPNPFLIGPEAVSRYYGVLHECLQAAEIRAQGGATPPLR